MTGKEKREKNLIPLNKLPPDEAQEIRKKGGKKSAAVKKEKKAMNEVAKIFLDLDLSDTDKEQIRKKYNLDDNVLTKRYLLVAQLYGIINTAEETATNRMAAMRLLIELAGESPAQIAIKEAASQKQNEIEDDPFSQSLKAMFGGDNK